MRTPLLAFVLALTLTAACSQSADREATTGLPPAATPTKAGAANKYPVPLPVTGKADEFPIRKTAAEWKKTLTAEQYHILREQGTERPYANPYWDNHAKGNYYCAADHNLLFSSATKFESGTGWPSFWAPAAGSSLKIASDRSLGMSRDEIVCAKCGGHLGHVFDDGPEPTSLRYCLDSYGMVFEQTK